MYDNLPVFSDFQALKMLWDNQDYPFWALYYGHLEGRKTPSSFITRSKTENKEESFRLLTELIKRSSKREGTKLTIFISSTLKGHGDGQTWFYESPTAQTAAGVPVAAIAGTANNQSMNGISSAKEYADIQVKLAMLERDRDDAYAQIHGNMSPMSRLVEAVAEDPATFLASAGNFCAQIAAAFAGNRNQYTVTGTTQQPNQAQRPQQPTPQTENTDTAISEDEQGEIIAAALDKIADEFGELHVVLPKIVKVMVDNKALVLMELNKQNG